MKKIIFIIIGVVITNFTLYSQNEVDALRYSQSFYGGTARAVGMAGAFGALGGEISSLSYNPAGIGIYRRSEFTFTPTFYFNKTSADYLNTTNEDFKYNLNLNNLGLVATYNTKNESGWISVNFGFGYNRMNNFHKNISIEGYNSTGSMTDYFAKLANGHNSDDLNGFNEGLAWESYLIDPDTNNIDEYRYVSAFSNYGELQRKNISSKGSVGEYIFTLGTNYNNMLYLGGTIGIQSVNYTENTEYSETDENNVIPDFNNFIFTQHLKTKGTGFNFKFGAIFRPVDWVRIGAAIHTPTFFDLTDTYSSSISSSFADASKSSQVDSKDGDYNYELTTPFKAVGSIGFVIKKSAIIGIDYEFVDYTLARLRASDYSFRTENNSIETHYQATANIRAGIEYRIGPFSIRAGYGLYGSPYKSDQVNKDAFTTSYSGGFGIKNKDFFFDLAYTYNTSEEKYYLYDPYYVNIKSTNLKSTSSQFLATIGFKF